MRERRAVQSRTQTESGCAQTRRRFVRGLLCERERHNRRILRTRTAVYGSPLDLFQTGDQLRTERVLMPEDPVCALPDDPLHSGVQSSDAGYIDCPCFQRIRQKVRHSE